MHQRTETRLFMFFWARLASFGHLGLLNDPLIVSKLLFVAPIVGFCVCSMFCCTLLCILSSFAIIMHDGEERAGCFILFFSF